VSAGAVGVVPARAAQGHISDGTFGSPGSGPGQLTEPEGVAVEEATGEVYVVDKGDDRVERFGAAGQYKGQFDGSGKFEDEGKQETGVAAGFGGRSGEIETGAFAGPESVAVDSSIFSPSRGDVYVLDTGHKVVDKFSATGEYLGQLPGLGPELEGAITGIGVDSGGRVWVILESGTVFEYNHRIENELASTTQAVVPGCFNVPGFAVASEADFEDQLYVQAEAGCREGGPVAKFSTTGALLNSVFFPEPATGLATELGSDDVYLDTGAALERVSPQGLVESSPLESLSLAGGAGSGVGVDSSSGRLYVAQSQADDVEIFALEPAGPPTVEKESASTITADSAMLEASINPRGAGVSYHFEYGPCATSGTCPTSGYATSEPIPEGTAAAGFGVVAVTPVNAQNLSAGTTYHYRVVAHNEHGTADGKEASFTTQTAGPLTLPDEREWELVSPIDKRGAQVERIGDQVTIQASAAGSAMTYTADAPTEPEPQGFSGPVQVFSTRGADGWASRDMSPPHESATIESTMGAQYRLFSEDLSQSVLQPFGAPVACASPEGAAQPCLSPNASEQTAFVQTSFLDGDPGEPCLPPAMQCYEPLVTGAAGVANVPPNTHFGQEGECSGPEPKRLICGPVFYGATADLKHVLLRSETALTSPEGGILYESSADKPPDEQLAAISVLPESEGGGAASAGAALGFNDENVRHAISADGSLVFWSTGTSSKEEGPLYVRHIVSGPVGETLRLTTGNGVFQDASSVGSRVFYSEGGTLFECAIAVAPNELKCPPAEVGQGFEGVVLGASEDGSWVSFVATNVLENAGVPVQGAVSGEPNLYMRHDGTTYLVAVLSKSDFPDWAGADRGNLATLTGRVSPNGKWLAFMSLRELTGYNNHDAVSGKPDEEVFLYNGETQKLVCASCDPTGARPVGEEGRKASPVDGGIVVGEAWEQTSTWLAANVPGWTAYRQKDAVYQSRYLSNSGRLFFNAIDSLVPQAVNGNWDVYEYEPPNVGSCTEGSPTFSEPSQGCVDLISGGNSTRESAFLDASEKGGDVFFITTAKLVPQDSDESPDVYDAHTCTPAEPCFPQPVTQAPACETEASCRPAPAPQPSVFGAPASSTFSGPGNFAPSPPAKKTAPMSRAERLSKALAVCRKKRRGRGRTTCERDARKRYGAAKKASKR
jgi:hypothetical protein